MHLWERILLVHLVLTYYFWQNIFLFKTNIWFILVLWFSSVDHRVRNHSSRCFEADVDSRALEDVSAQFQWNFYKCSKWCSIGWYIKYSLRILWKSVILWDMILCSLKQRFERIVDLTSQLIRIIELTS